MYKNLVFIIFIFNINYAYSEVYKWTDEDGKTVYGDKPLAEEVDIIEIKKRPKKDKHYEKRYEKQQKLIDVMQEEREQKITAEKEELEKNEKKEKECAEMREKLKKMKESSHLFEETDDPNNPIIYTDEERRINEDKFEKHIDENC
jgi:ribosomal protein S10